jgi:hypothetical protein
MFIADFRSAMKAGRLIHSASPLKHRHEESSAASTDTQRRSFLNVASEKWKNLDPIMKAKYDGFANEEKERYKIELTQWEIFQGTPNHPRRLSLRLPQIDVSGLEEFEDQKLSPLAMSRGLCDVFVAPCWSESTADNLQQASLFSQTLLPQIEYTNQYRRNSDSALVADEVTANVPQRSFHEPSMHTGNLQHASMSAVKLAPQTKNASQLRCKSDSSLFADDGSATWPQCGFHQPSQHEHVEHELEDTPTLGHGLYPSTVPEDSESSYMSYDMTPDHERMQYEFELERCNNKLQTVMEENAAIHKEQYSSYQCQKGDVVALVDALGIPKDRLRAGNKYGLIRSPSLQESMKFEFRGETLMENDFAPQGRGCGPSLPSSSLDLNKVDQGHGDMWEVAGSFMRSKKEDYTVSSLAKEECSKPVCTVLDDALWSELKDLPLIDDDEFTADDESVMSRVDESVFDADNNSTSSR